VNLKIEVEVPDCQQLIINRASLNLVSAILPQKIVALNPRRDNVAAYPVSSNRHWRDYIPYANADETRPASGVHVD
jgi:hypothetical protein